MGIFDIDGNKEDEMYYGVVCASKYSGRPVKEIENEVKNVEKEKKNIAEKEAEEKFLETVLENAKNAPTPIRHKVYDSSIVINWVVDAFIKSFLPSHLGKVRGEKFFCKKINTGDGIKAWQTVQGEIYCRVKK